MSSHNHISLRCLRCDHRQDAIPYRDQEALDKFKQHLIEAHGVPEDGFSRLTQRPAGHVDADEWYEWDHRVSLDKQPLFREIVRRERKP